MKGILLCLVVVLVCVVAMLYGLVFLLVFRDSGNISYGESDDQLSIYSQFKPSDNASVYKVVVNGDIYWTTGLVPIARDDPPSSLLYPFSNLVFDLVTTPREQQRVVLPKVHVVKNGHVYALRNSVGEAVVISRKDVRPDVNNVNTGTTSISRKLLVVMHGGGSKEIFTMLLR